MYLVARLGGDTAESSAGFGWSADGGQAVDPYDRNLHDRIHDEVDNFDAFVRQGAHRDVVLCITLQFGAVVRHQAQHIVDLHEGGEFALIERFGLEFGHLPDQVDRVGHYRDTGWPL